MLQWGRRFSSAEITWHLSLRSPARAASMGPPIFIGGNQHSLSPHRMNYGLLQWGRRFSSAEIAPSVVVVLSSSQASMGPPIFIGGNAGIQNAWRPCPAGFNGAADFHRRKYAVMKTEFTAIVQLQWGRRFSSAEITRLDRLEQMYTRLQWGRRFSSAEMVSPLQPVLNIRVASMGPPIFIGGNPPTVRGIITRLPHGFNGAADFHRRKYESARQQYTRHAGFNGAADFHRRKSFGCSHASEISERASMGPPIFIGGNLVGGNRREPVDQASMGPPIFIGGNIVISGLLLPTVPASMGPPIFIGGNTGVRRSPFGADLLQWGRRFSSAEMGRPSSISVSDILASMGPPIFIGGNPGSSWLTAWKLISFNGAADFHRRKSPEIIHGILRRGHASMGPPIFIGGNVISGTAGVGAAVLLQWGRRFSSAEITASPKSFSQLTSLQWGRRFSSAEIQAILDNSQCMSGFNGAADFHRRKSQKHQDAMNLDQMLQWGRRFSSAEMPIASPTRGVSSARFNGAADFHRRK